MLLLAGAMTAARALRAQQLTLPVVGYLGPGAPESARPFRSAFLNGLAETGYVEGRNVVIEYRWAEGKYDRLPSTVSVGLTRSTYDRRTAPYGASRPFPCVRARSPNWTDSGRSAWGSGTGLHATFRSLPSTSLHKSANTRG